MPNEKNHDPLAAVRGQMVMNEPEDKKETFYLDADPEPPDFGALAKLSPEQLLKLRDEELQKLRDESKPE